MAALSDLADAVGLATHWESAAGRPEEVGQDALRQILGALGYPAEDQRALDRSLQLRLRENAELALAFLTGETGRPLQLPREAPQVDRVELLLEDGRTTALGVELRNGVMWADPISEMGYHRLVVGGREIPVAIAPPRCFGVEDLGLARRPWGVAVQTPSLRNERGLAFGDFGALGDAAARLASAGADALAFSPAHALFPDDGTRFSPYSPSSRLFLNILLADPSVLGMTSGPTEVQDLIDWEKAIPARLAMLRAAHHAASDPVRDAVQAYMRDKGTALEHHAAFDALHAHFLGEGRRGWREWPSGYHSPESADVVRFVAAHGADVEFFAFAQWLAELSLENAHDKALRSGMAIGLISDLAVGLDSGGSEAWSRPDDLLLGLTVGAPPDALGPDGQNWGLTSFAPDALRRKGFAPFIETLRAGLRHAGGIRIDHALGMKRLWVIPEGGNSSDGAYLTYPLDDFLRIVSIESRRSRSIVVGEDLGTVPKGLRDALEARGILGMRVLWFERDGEEFSPPQDWTPCAAAMSGTHDLPTVAGWWRGRDIEWRAGLAGELGTAYAENAQLERDKDRERLWRAFCASSSAVGPRPAADDPAPVVDAAIAHLGQTACDLALLPIEDVAGLVEQPNLPGTLDEHPNWRRRLPVTTAALLAQSEVKRRLERLARDRAG